MKVTVINTEGTVLAEYSNRDGVPGLNHVIIIEGTRWTVQRVVWHDYLRHVDLHVREDEWS